MFILLNKPRTASATKVANHGETNVYMYTLSSREQCIDRPSWLILAKKAVFTKPALLNIPFKFRAIECTQIWSLEIRTRTSEPKTQRQEPRNLQLNGSSKGTNRARSSAATALSTSLLQPRSAVSHALDLLLAKQHEHMSVATDARSARGAAPKRATTALTARNVAGSRRKWRASATVARRRTGATKAMRMRKTRVWRRKLPLSLWCP